MATRTLNVLLTGDATALKSTFASAARSATGAKAGIAAVAVGAVVAGKALYDLGAEFDDAYDKIRVGTGKTGKQLEGLKSDFKNVVAHTPSDFEDAADAISGLNERLGLTGKPLRERSKQFLELSRITETDLTGNIRTVTRAFGDWEISTAKQGKALDFLFRASQKSGAPVEELADNVVKFGAPLRQIGFSFEEATAMFAEFEKAGVNTTTMLPGLKMAMKVFFQEDVDPKEGILKTFKGIEDGTIKTSEALKIFGTRAGGDMVEAIEQGRFHLGKFTSELAHGNDTILKAGNETKDAAERFKELGNTLKVALEPAATGVFNAVSELARILTNPKLDASEKFSRISNKLGSLASKGFQKVTHLAAEFGPKIALALGRGIFQAWLGMSPLEKLFGAAVIVRAVGGKGALLSVGRYIGGLFGTGVTEGAAAGVATGSAEGAGAAGAAGGLGGALSKWGKRAIKGAAAALGGIFVAEFGANIAEELTGSDILEGQDLVTSLTHGFNTSGVAETEKRALDQAKAAEKINRKFRLLRSGVLATSRDISKVSHEAQGMVGRTFEKGSREARNFTAMNLRATAKAYETNMQAAGRTTKKGMNHVESLIRKANLIQAGRHQAVGFGREWARGMDHSKEITRGGVQRMISELKLMPPASRRVAVQTWLAQLTEARDKGTITKQEFRKLRSKVVSEFQGIKLEGGKNMRGLNNLIQDFAQHNAQYVAGKGANSWRTYKGAVANTATSVKGNVRGIDRATVTSIADIIAKLNTGLVALGQPPVGSVKKQRGGNIAGAGSGDKIPALLEPGEYVLNRNAVAAIGKETLDTLNFSMAARFQKGGILGHEPHVSGAGTVRGMGQNAVHRVFQAAKRYYNRHNGKARVIQNGDRMDALHQPYLWGGGHGPTADPNGPWDCSGGISELFDGAGWNFAPMVSSGFMNWGLPGKGDVTVLANPEHVYAVVEGHGAIGTSGENPGGGFGWIGGYTFRPGFAIRHANFDEQDGPTRSGGTRGKGQKQKKGFQKGGYVVSGKASFEGGTGHGTADGKHTDEDPGFAIRDDKTLGDWFRVKVLGKTGLLQHIDWGPAAWTGRAIDFTAAGLKKIGVDPASVTDKPATVEWMGHSVGEAVKRMGGAGRGGGGGGSKPHYEIGLGKGKAVELPPLAPGKVPKILQGLGPGITSLFKSPGLSREGRFEASELALGIASETEGHADDEAVLKYQMGASKARKKAIQKELARIGKRLQERLSPAQRKHLLAKRNSLLQELGTVQGRIVSAREGLSGLSETEEGEDPLQAAIERQTEEAEKAREVEEERIRVEQEHMALIKELDQELELNRHIAESEAGVSATVARTALADIISGQLGPRSNHKAQTAGAGTVGTF